MIPLYHVSKRLSTVKLHKDFGIVCATCLCQNFTCKFVQLAQTKNSARRGRQRAAAFIKSSKYAETKGGFLRLLFYFLTQSVQKQCRKIVMPHSFASLRVKQGQAIQPFLSVLFSKAHFTHRLSLTISIVLHYLVMSTNTLYGLWCGLGSQLSVTMSTHERKNHNRTARHVLYSVTFAALRIIPHLFPQFPKLRRHALVTHTAVITGPIADLIPIATAEAAQKFVISHNNTPFFWALHALAERPYRALRAQSAMCMISPVSLSMTATPQKPSSLRQQRATTSACSLIYSSPSACSSWQASLSLNTMASKQRQA